VYLSNKIFFYTTLTISRFRQLSTEDEIPAWRKAVVGGSYLFISFIISLELL
jgi:hypothetical protein